MKSTFLQAGQEIQKRKIALGFFIISVFYILGSFTIGLVCSNASICSFSSGLGRTPLNLLFVLLTFIPIWIGVWMAMKFVHRIPMNVLFGSSSKLDLQLLLRGFLAMLFLGIGIEAILQFIPAVSKYIYYEPNKVLFLSDWIKWLLPMVLFIFVQSAAEELVFRGYLLQIIWSKSASYLYAVICPSLVFGLLHFDSQSYGANAWYYCLNTFVVGCLLCLVTLHTGNIALAFGLHWGGNTVSLVFFGIHGNLDGMALWLTYLDPQSETMGVALIVSTIFIISIYCLWALFYFGSFLPTFGVKEPK
jgi:membrane protease YdiL (CAAX protease family)